MSRRQTPYLTGKIKKEILRKLDVALNNPNKLCEYIPLVYGGGVDYKISKRVMALATAHGLDMITTVVAYGFKPGSLYLIGFGNKSMREENLNFKIEELDEDVKKLLNR